MRVGFAELKASISDSLRLVRADVLKWTMGALGLQVVAVIAAMLGIVRMMR